jgi:hypothetical protein
MTKKQLRQYAAFVTHHAKRRRQLHGANFSAVDFAMGASCLFAFLQHDGDLPANWLLPEPFPQDAGRE